MSKLLHLLEDAPTELQEPILSPSLNDYQPGTKDKYFKHLNKMRQFMWFPDEISLVDDESHIKFKMSAAEIKLIKTILLFFNFADGVVADNTADNFGQEVQPMYIKACYRFAAMMEDIHAETYKNLLMALFPGNYDEVCATILKSPTIKKKIAWMAKWMNRDTPFAQRIAAFLCVEGIFFSASFATIFWFKSRGLLPGNAQANELISRDENMHQELAILVYNDLVAKCDSATIHQIFTEAVEVECGFIQEALTETILDLNCQRLETYTKFIADRLLEFIGYEKIYKVKNPCDYMYNLCLESKVNFFEQTATAYKPLYITDKLKKLNEY